MRAWDARCRALRGVFLRPFEAFEMFVSFGTFAVVTKL
jgi:hypothetical protein